MIASTVFILAKLQPRWRLLQRAILSRSAAAHPPSVLVFERGERPQVTTIVYVAKYLTPGPNLGLAPTMNRSAEHRLGKFPPCLQRAETVLGAPIALFMAPMRVQCCSRALAIWQRSIYRGSEVQCANPSGKSLPKERAFTFPAFLEIPVAPLNGNHRARRPWLATRRGGFEGFIQLTPPAKNISCMLLTFAGTARGSCHPPPERK